MSQVRWVGTPCRYARSAPPRKRIDRWIVGVKVAREHSHALNAEICCTAICCVATFFTVLFIVAMLTA